MEPLGPLTFDEAVAAFKAQCEGLREGGADVAWIETMSSPDEIRAALQGAGEAGLEAVWHLLPSIPTAAP